MNKKTLSYITFILLLLVCFGCGEGKDPYKDYVKVKTYCDKVVYTNVYTNLTDEKSYGILDSEYDFYFQGGGCTAVAKNSYYDGMIVGRNMDLYITDKASYIVKTDIEGYKRTFGLTYNPFQGDSFDIVKEHGVDPTFYDLIPYLQTDVMNEDGLYIETNMRSQEYNALYEAVFSCSGTNPGKKRLLTLLLPYYIGLRCSTVDEAIRMCEEELDLYTPTPGKANVDWNFCFLIADATGKYGILEIAKNKVVWNEAVVDEQNPDVMPVGACQANFYISDEFKDIETLKAGTGRYDYLAKKWKDITCEEIMYQDMLGVSYYQTYFPYCQYNQASEFVGYYEEDGEIFVGSNTPDVLDGEIVVWDYDFINNPENKKYIDAYINHCFTVLSVDRSDGTVEDKAKYWESVFTLVANCSNKTVFVRFNENAKSILFFKFSEWN